MKRQLTLNFLPFLSMLYIVSIITGFIFVAQEVSIPVLGIVSTGAFIFPICFTCLDVIAEIYGYEMAKKVIWSGLSIQGFFCLVVYVLLHIHSIKTGEAFATTKTYYEILGRLPRIYFGTSMATLTSMFLNAYVLCKWKLLLKGKKFWIRSISSSIIGDGAFTAVAIVIISSGVAPFRLIISFFVLSFLLKILTILILAYPSVLFTNFLKVYEGEYSSKIIDFNPFKLTTQKEE